MSIVDALVSVQAENVKVSLEKPENLAELPEGSVIVDQVCQAWQAGEPPVWYPAGFRGNWSPGDFGGPQFPVTVVHIPPRFVGDGDFDVDAVHDAVGDCDE